MQESKAKTILHYIESGTIIVLMLVLIAAVLRFYFQTLPIIHEETQNVGLVTVQNGAKTRALLDQLSKRLPEEQDKVGKVLDDTHQVLQDTHKVMQDTDTLIVKLGKNQDAISHQTVETLKALRAGINTTSEGVKSISDQTVKTEAALETTANAATQTAKSAAGTADAATDTAHSATTLVKAVTDPTVKSMQNVQAATGDFKDATADAKTWFHGLLHPKWPKAVWGEVKDFAAKTLGAWL